MPEPAPAATDQLRRLQRVWAGIAAFVLLAALGMAWLGAGRVEPRPWATVVFYANAFLNIAALLAAFAVMRRMPWHLRAAQSREDAVGAIRQTGFVALAALEVGAVVAICAAYLTGEWVNLAFLIPFFGFVAAFFPSAGRIARWRGT